MNKVSFNDPWHAVSFIYFFMNVLRLRR